MSKLVPLLVQNFDFELQGEVRNQRWDTKNYWFVKPTNFLVKVCKRVSV